MTIVAQAIRFYLRPESVEAGWAYPKFLEPEPERGERAGVEVHVERALWKELGAEARRQDVADSTCSSTRRCTSRPPATVAASPPGSSK